MAVTWLHCRGPGSVNFERMVVPLDAAGGTATTSARFREPGTYDVHAGHRHRYQGVGGGPLNPADSSASPRMRDAVRKRKRSAK